MFWGCVSACAFELPLSLNKTEMELRDEGNVPSAKVKMGLPEGKQAVRKETTFFLTEAVLEGFCVSEK